MYLAIPSHASPESETSQPTESSFTPSDLSKEERGDRTAENIRYGQNISENGMGGMTANQDNSATSDGMLISCGFLKSVP